MTLEEAQERIVELEEQLTEVQNERDTVQQNNATLTADNENLRRLNQKYFNKLTQQTVPKEEPAKDEPEQSLEDFAKTINI